MPMQTEKLLADVLAAAGGEIVGKIRLQKVIYLLDQLGLNSGTKFSYYHYGPYAEQINSGALLAQFIDGNVFEEEKISGYGGKYSVFKLVENYRAPTRVGDLTVDQASRFIQRMKSKTSVELELAATIHWLATKEKVSNWRNELAVRKPQKATDQNVTGALQLLHELGLNLQ